MSCVMPDEFISPPLRISNIVHGRRKTENRVEYLLDPTGKNRAEYDIPEQIVLKRWRARKHKYHNFGGMRLSPNIWRSIRLVLGEDCTRISKMSDNEINVSYQNVSEEFTAANYKKVSGENILKLIKGIGLAKFQILIARHNDPDRSSIYGTPDLFLWATSKVRKTIKYVRFVEVKRPREHIKAHQKAEIAFLNHELNLKARVLRLIEANEI